MNKFLEMKQKFITLRAVNTSDFRFLFNLLKERNPRTNISHKKIPTYSEHIKFVKSKPYSKWYIIENSKTKVGSIYLSKSDEVGIFLKKTYQRKGFANDALKLLIEKNSRARYLANVNPKNDRSNKFFKKNGFKLIQYTFELEKN